jgi:hypothetical protein
MMEKLVAAAVRGFLATPEFVEVMAATMMAGPETGEAVAGLKAYSERSPGYEAFFPAAIVAAS